MQFALNAFLVDLALTKYVANTAYAIMVSKQIQKNILKFVESETSKILSRKRICIPNIQWPRHKQH